ncbi:CIR protein [Plasmodium chabaudi adami]|uniref:CIR protein n=1 Tax=Plasmodium chabaudi adami TaxID=5826 RepID=A0A1C6WCZ9_PLACE|nr:CIR protein [Plasmodium chabaudi adami]
METKLCKLFIDVDKLFTKGNINVNKFNDSDSYKKFCPKGVCNTNYDRIGALCEYLLAELPKNYDKQKGGNNNGNLDYEYIYMWLADKFLKVNDDYSFSLNDYYEELIVKPGDNFSWWEKLDDKMLWKDSNIILMARFYYLLMDICNALLENEKSELDLKKIKENDSNCYLTYYFLKQRVSRCSPYAQLLVDLKKTYDEYKILVNKKIEQGKHGKIKFSDFPSISNYKYSPVELEFESSGCKRVHLFFQKHGTKYKPKSIMGVFKSSSNGKEKHKGPKKEPQKPTNNDTKPSTKNNTQQPAKEETIQSIKKENQPSEPKAPDPKISDISQKSDSQVQILPIISQEIQKVPQDNIPVSLDDKGTPKDMEIISENHVNEPENAKIRSKRDLQLSDIPPTPQQNEPLPPSSELTYENIPVKPENNAAESTNKTIEPTNITPYLNDNLPDTENRSAKRTKRSASQDNSENQKETTKTENTGSSSTQSKDTQESSDFNKELNIKNVIDYSVDFFQTCSSLFNDTVNKIEGHIHDMVISKVDDIIDKIPKYQQIIQKVCSSIGQIQIVNDHQNESEKSQKICEKPQNEKVEQSGLTKTTEETTGCLDGISSMLVSEPGSNVMGLNGHITKLLSFNFEGYKVAIMALMAVSIPIVLVIMYKYLYYGCGKTSKKKKMVKKIISSHNGKRKVKKIINSIDGKRTLKTVINPIDRKKNANTIISPINVKKTLKTIINPIDEENTANTIPSPNYEKKNIKTIINSDYGEKTTIVIINSYDEKDVTIQSVKSSSPKTTSLNAYKHIFANPAPFINLFFLLIFFVYKRKYNFL